MKMFCRKKIKIGGVFMLLVVFCFMVSIFWQSSEPAYNGRKLSAWAKEVCSPGFLSSSFATPSLRAQNDRAVAAIRQIGTNALPFALELCRAKDSWLKKQWEQATRDDSDGVSKFRITPAWEKHMEGGNIIWALGPVAEPAIPALIKLLQSRNREVAMDVMQVLPGAGTNVISSLLELLNNANEDVRIRAALVLGDYFTPQAHDAVPVLLECLESQDQNLSMRIHAVHCLGLIKADAPIVVPVILRQLQNETNNLMQSDYLRVLGNFGTNANAAVPILVHILESNPHEPFYPTKAQVLHNLYKIDPEAAQPFIDKYQASLANERASIPTAIHIK